MKVKTLIFTALSMIALVACSDYQQMLADDYGDMNWGDNAAASNPSNTGSPSTPNTPSNAGSPSTSVSNDKSGSFVDGRDNKVYNYVTIGSQTWMAQNLNYEVPFSYCYEDKVKNCDAYGRLYSWAAAMGRKDAECGASVICGVTTYPYRGVCPSGWHLPTNAEWELLLATVGNSGDFLKSKTTWTANGVGSDNYGFSALPAGHRSASTYFEMLGSYTSFWTSSEFDKSDAHRWYFRNTTFADGNASKVEANSVRCIKD